jgi:hypothetical protein
VQGYPPAHAGGYASIPIPAAQQPSAQGYARIDGPDEYEEDEYEEEPKRRRPSFMIIGALVGAICAGGGLAYAYKSYFSGSNSGPTPLLRADQSPTKAKAASSGSKVNERFGDTSTGSAVAAASDTDLGRPRAVATQTIAVSPPPVMNAPPPTASSGVPGLVLDGAGIGPRPLPPVVPVAPPGPTPVGRPLPPVAPAVVPQAGGGPQPIQPRVVAAAPPVAPPAAPAAAPQPVPKVAKAPPPKANDAYVPGAGAGVAAAAPPAAAGKAGLGAAPSGAAGGNGHVAVVASQKDRLAAMKAFADLQQKHPSILGSKMAEVVEVNLGEAKGGVWFRALVGPPGSREAADKICADLRAAGVPKNQCWATAY